jgi:hypothetical protein
VRNLVESKIYAAEKPKFLNQDCHTFFFEVIYILILNFSTNTLSALHYESRHVESNCRNNTDVSQTLHCVREMRKYKAEFR